MIDIAKARALCAAATPGPWTFTTCYGVATVEHGPDRDAIAHAVDYLQVGDEYDNASFIASARTLLPEALDALEQEHKMSSSLAERTDEFDVVLDLASSTLSDGSTVEAMRLARGLMAMETYMDKMANRIEALERENAALWNLLSEADHLVGFCSDPYMGPPLQRCGDCPVCRFGDALAALAPEVKP